MKTDTMKKYFSLSLMALVSFVFVGCSSDGNDVLSNVEDNGKKVTTITISLPDEGETRTNYEDNNGLKVTWAEGDKIAIYADADDANPDEFTLASKSDDGKTGTFSGTLTKSGTSCPVVYPYTTDTKSGDVLKKVLAKNQEGTLADLGKYDVMTGTYNTTTGTMSELEHQIAVMKITTPAIGGQTGVSIRGAWGDKLYYASSTATTSNIAVEAVNVAAGTNLYASTYVSDSTNVYTKNIAAAKTMSGKKINIDFSSISTAVSYPVTGVQANHEYVTIGSKNWATCNVGACVPWEYGNYYNWGLTIDKMKQDNKYDYFTGTSDIQKTANDAAYVNWGNGWMMPNENQLTALNESSNNVWEALNGINGRKIGTTSAYVFLPAAGFDIGGNLYVPGRRGDYWSSTPEAHDPNDYDYADYAMFLHIYEGKASMSSDFRYRGRSVRPLLSASE